MCCLAYLVPIIIEYDNLLVSLLVALIYITFTIIHCVTKYSNSCPAPPYRSGDIASLCVEAVVNPTNEGLTDKNPISTRLFEMAGPELRDECKSQIGCTQNYITMAIVTWLLWQSLLVFFLYIETESNNIIFYEKLFMSLQPVVLGKLGSVLPINYQPGMYTHTHPRHTHNVHTHTHTQHAHTHTRTHTQTQRTHTHTHRHVIHTVGPRYNPRYRTAAESALYNCYRSVMQIVKCVITYQQISIFQAPLVV